MVMSRGVVYFALSPSISTGSSHSGQFVDGLRTLLSQFAIGGNFHIDRVIISLWGFSFLAFGMLTGGEK